MGRACQVPCSKDLLFPERKHSTQIKGHTPWAGAAQPLQGRSMWGDKTQLHVSGERERPSLSSWSQALAQAALAWGESQISIFPQPRCLLRLLVSPRDVSHEPTDSPWCSAQNCAFRP